MKKEIKPSPELLSEMEALQIYSGRGLEGDDSSVQTYCGADSQCLCIYYKCP